MNYALGIEFVELTLGQPAEKKRLVNSQLENAKGFHGNAILSRFPLRRVEILRLDGEPGDAKGGPNAYWRRGGFDGEHVGRALSTFEPLCLCRFELP